MSVPEACFVIFQIVMLRQVSAVIHIVGNLSLPDGIIDGWGGCLDVLVAWFAGGVACWECGLLGVWFAGSVAPGAGYFFLARPLQAGIFPALRNSPHPLRDCGSDSPRAGRENPGLKSVA